MRRLEGISRRIALRGTQRDRFGRKGQAIHRRYIFEKSGQPCHVVAPELLIYGLVDGTHSTVPIVSIDPLL